MLSPTSIIGNVEKIDYFLWSNRISPFTLHQNSQQGYEQDDVLYAMYYDARSMVGEKLYLKIMFAPASSVGVF